MKIVKQLVLMALLLCVPVVTAVAAEKMNLRIGSSSIEGGFYQAAGLISQLWQAELPKYVSSAVTGSSGRNCLLVSKGDLEFALSGTSTLNEAIEGKGPFKKPVGRLRYVTSIYPLVLHVMVASKSGIKSVSDWTGKNIDFNAVGSNVETAMRELLPLWGVDIKSLKVQRLGRSEFEESWRNGIIDAAFYGTPPPNAMVDDLTRNKEVFLLTPEPDIIDKVVKQYPHYIRYTIPGGEYSAYPQDIATFATPGALVTHEGMPDEVIYKITKVLHGNASFLRERQPNRFRDFNLKTALDGMGDKITVHPGALKYYKEKGLL